MRRPIEWRDQCSSTKHLSIVSTSYVGTSTINYQPSTVACPLSQTPPNEAAAHRPHPFEVSTNINCNRVGTYYWLGWNLILEAAVEIEDIWAQGPVRV